jgi:hypothetical protein
MCLPSDTTGRLTMAPSLRSGRQRKSAACAEMCPRRGAEQGKVWRAADIEPGEEAGNARHNRHARASVAVMRRGVPPLRLHPPEARE